LTVAQTDVRGHLRARLDRARHLAGMTATGADRVNAERGPRTSVRRLAGSSAETAEWAVVATTFSETEVSARPAGAGPASAFVILPAECPATALASFQWPGIRPRRRAPRTSTAERSNRVCICKALILHGVSRAPLPAMSRFGDAPADDRNDDRGTDDDDDDVWVAFPGPVSGGRSLPVLRRGSGPCPSRVLSAAQVRHASVFPRRSPPHADAGRGRR